MLIEKLNGIVKITMFHLTFHFTDSKKYDKISWE